MRFIERVGPLLDFQETQGSILRSPAGGKTTWGVALDPTSGFQLPTPHMIEMRIPMNTDKGNLSFVNPLERWG